MTNEKYPRGWNEDRVLRVLEYYESQSDEEAESDLEAGRYSDYTDETLPRLAAELKCEARAFRDNGQR